MNKLYFKPATSIIEGNYFVCPKSEDSWERVIFKTDKLGAFLLSLLVDELTCEKMAEIAKTEFPYESEKTILNKSIKIKNTISSLTLEENKLEVIEI